MGGSSTAFGYGTSENRWALSDPINYGSAPMGYEYSALHPTNHMYSTYAMNQ